MSCDATVPRQFEQSSGRYNDQTSQTLLASQQNFVMQQQANWATLMQAVHDNHLSSQQNNHKAIDRMFRS